MRTRLQTWKPPLRIALAILSAAWCAAASARDSAAPDYQNRWYNGANPAAPTATAVFNGHVGATPGDPHVPQSAQYSVLNSRFGLPVFGVLAQAPIVDSDGDGLPDAWEEANGLNPDSDIGDDGADGDPDDDGLTNAEELDAETNPRDWDSDDDGLPDGWEVDYDLDPLVGGDADDDPDGDGSPNIQECYGNGNPRNPGSVPTPTATLLQVTSGAALVVGGSTISAQGVFLHSGCQITVGGDACTGVSVVDVGGVSNLTALAPPGTAGSADLVVSDPVTRTSDSIPDGVTYTANPFDPMLDTAPSVVHTWDEGTSAAVYAYLPDTGSLAMMTPQGTALTLPAALRGAHPAAFILVRDGQRLGGLRLDQVPRTPDGCVSATPAIDIAGLVFNGTTTLEIDEPFAQAVTVTFPLTRGTTDDPLLLGYIETHLGLDLFPFCATPPGEVAQMLAGAAPVSVDPVDQTATFELYDFTAYTGLIPGSYAPCDINQDGAVNAVDVQLVINGALGMVTGYNCDVNTDTSTNAIDVQMVINSALGITKETTP